MDSYKEENVERYYFLSEPDERRCEICQEHHMIDYAVNDAKVGENYPPLHCNCRCTTIPVTKYQYQPRPDYQKQMREWKEQIDKQRANN